MCGHCYIPPPDPASGGRDCSGPSASDARRTRSYNDEHTVTDVHERSLLGYLLLIATCVGCGGRRSAPDGGAEPADAHEEADSGAGVDAAIDCLRDVPACPG